MQEEKDEKREEEIPRINTLQPRNKAETTTWKAGEIVIPRHWISSTRKGTVDIKQVGRM